MRSKMYGLLDLPVVQTRLHLPADQQITLPESPLVRMLYDCPEVPVGADGQAYRLVVATHPKGPKKQRIGVDRDGLIYELFLTKLPQEAFTASDVVAVYLHRGSFETVLSDEDREQDPDRWCSQSACAQEAWQIVCQWTWNLRLELGHHLEPGPMRTTEFAPARPHAQEETSSTSSPIQGYGPPEVASSWKQGRFSGRDFVPQPDGTLHCPAGQTLRVNERRKEGNGSLRVVYAASIRSCRSCSLREQCQWNGKETSKPRQVSVLLHPLAIGDAPLLWHDWSRREHRRACRQLVCDQHIEILFAEKPPSQGRAAPVVLSRAQRAHFRLSWAERLMRNACAPAEGPVRIKLFGIPEHFADFLGLLPA